MTRDLEALESITNILMDKLNAIELINNVMKYLKCKCSSSSCSSLIEGVCSRHLKPLLFCNSHGGVNACQECAIKVDECVRCCKFIERCLCRTCGKNRVRCTERSCYIQDKRKRCPECGNLKRILKRK